MTREEAIQCLPKFVESVAKAIHSLHQKPLQWAHTAGECLLQSLYRLDIYIKLENIFDKDRMQVVSDFQYSQVQLSYLWFTLALIIQL